MVTLIHKVIGETKGKSLINLNPRRKREMMSEAIKQIDVGTTANFKKMITYEDIQKFAEATGDFNRLHLECDYADKTIFRERIAHGILSLGVISAAVAKLPGVVVYKEQTAKFVHPVKINDTLEAIAEVLAKNEEKSEVRIKTTCLNQWGEVVVSGEARVLVLDLKEMQECL
jgi:3-hydroxybutyryl-CoA dehydratase